MRVDIEELDLGSQLYTSKIDGATIPSTYANLQLFLATSATAKLDFDESMPLTDPSFRSFISEICAESNDCCFSYLSAFQLFASQPIHCRDYYGEMEVVSIVDAALFPLQILLQATTARNSKTATTGNKLPDYKLAVGSANVPVVLGEDKTFANYQMGVLGKDPVRDLESKAPWDSWEQFYGTIPYYFAYTCLGQSSKVELTVGVMDKESRKFLPLFSNNILSPTERPLFSASLLRMFPQL
jgi:hypothetical protein